MNILITGGAGYLGSVITKHLLDEGHAVTVIDNMLFNQLSPLPYMYNPMYNFIHGDVNNTKFLLKYVKSHDVIIPLAAIVGFPACAAQPNLAWETNYNHIREIMDVISPEQILLYPNTNSGYGIGGDNDECTEDSPLKPISIYGESKVESEKIVLRHQNSICFRLATVFGSSPRMRTDLLVNEFVYKALTDKYIVVFEKNFRRNFIHIQDVARVFVHSLNNFETMRGKVYNVGLSDANLTKQQLLEKIQEYIPDFAVEYSDFYEDPDKRDYIVSNKRIESTGWSPIYTIDDGIIELIKTYRVIIPRMTSEFRNGFPLGYAQTF